MEKLVFPVGKNGSVALLVGSIVGASLEGLPISDDGGLEELEESFLSRATSHNR